MVMQRYHIDTNAVEWQPSREGVDMIALRMEPGERRFLIRFAPGTDYPEHRHPQGEELFILQGYLVESGGTYGPGSYLYLGPESTHKASAPEGCVMLVIAPVPAEIL